MDVTERVLLERIRVLEAERMMLQLENENQQLQYERFLDVIANHIVEAIVSQKVGLYAVNSCSLWALFQSGFFRKVSLLLAFKRIVGL